MPTFACAVPRARARFFAVCLAFAAAGCGVRDREAPAPFVIEEATIAEMHEAMARGRLTARELVDRYTARIEAYDRQGPDLNAITVIHTGARARAAELDSIFAATGRFVGPLHGIPVIVKENFETEDLPTTAGSASLAGMSTGRDAFQVRRLREAGAIVLAKSNMAEFAFSAFETIGSAIEGHTRNPYDPERVPAGSSGGTAAAVAANFGAVGLGTDTGNSIRGPSAHTALVGIRPTMGLTSRSGIVPLFLDRDVGGPMARTVADAVAVLDVIAGHDPADPVTAASREWAAQSYAAHLREDGLAGARLGVLRRLSNTETADPEVVRRFDEALEDLRRGGAVVVDPVEIPALDVVSPAGEWCPRFRHDLEAYLDGLGDAAPFRTLDELLDSGAYHPGIEERLRSFVDEEPPATGAACDSARRHAARLTGAVRAALAEHELDALVFPTWSNPPRRIGDLESPHGNNSPQIAPHTGFPAITVPMGYVYGDLPVGLQILGDAWSEPRLIAIAYAYERATRHRRPPATTPPLEAVREPPNG